jgi:hypothetical protein
MSGPQTLLDHEGPLKTSAGACYPGERAVFRGHDLHRELTGLDWVELYAFGVSGKRLSAAQGRVLNAMFTYTSYPDARLWNNRVAALAGSTRSTCALALGAAVAVSDARIYGWQPLVATADFFVRAKRQLDQGTALRVILEKEIANHTHIRGYGRPVAVTRPDERIPAITARMAEEGVPQGAYLQMAFEIERTLQEMGKQLTMNYAGPVAAIPLDMGFSARECYLLAQPAFIAGMIPCYKEACERAEGATFALRCASVHYEGPASRRWDAEE